nr:MAG TPA: hypothetical protein [Caudoviricetes sp.]
MNKRNFVSYDKIIIDFSHNGLHRAKMLSDSRFRIK